MANPNDTTPPENEQALAYPWWHKAPILCVDDMYRRSSCEDYEGTCVLSPEQLLIEMLLHWHHEIEWEFPWRDQILLCMGYIRALRGFTDDLVYELYWHWPGALSTPEMAGLMGMEESELLARAGTEVIPCGAWCGRDVEYTTREELQNANTTWVNEDGTEEELCLGMCPECVANQEEWRQALIAQSHNAGFVYLVHLPETPWYKIGVSKDPRRRVKQFFTVAMPVQPQLVVTISTRTAYRLEAELHNRFAEKRMNGEWFALDATDVEYIKSLEVRA